MTGRAPADAATAAGVDGFERFYRDVRSQLYRGLALTLGDADLAAEAVDEAMVRACQRWSRVRGYDNPAGWVYRVGLNWAISRTRRAKRQVVVAEVHDGRTATQPGLPDEELQAALAELSPKLRAVVVLRFHLDWSLEQIADALDAPVGTVKSRLHRALAALRSELEVDR